MGGQPANHNLSVPWTSFVGRRDELATIARLLHEGRLVTLTGPGGTGKTRLALQAALAETGRFAGGVWLVELAALGQPGLVAETIAAALALPDRPGLALADRLAALLAARPRLLVLDNCEHRLDECARLAAELLARCPGLTILATSREALGLGGECIMQVAALALPALGPPPSVADLLRSEAVRLFVDRV
ncbi:MAG TPA: AAA family ATPase [Chloroflexia bacterium]|nr:AAA family ATPase [Chloroflexia bacterium]